MLLSTRVRDDLEREVLGTGFRMFFVRYFRGVPGLAGLSGPEDLIRLLRSPTARKQKRDAALCAVLQAYGQAGLDRARVGSLLLLVLWADLVAVVPFHSRLLAGRAGFSASDRPDL